MFSSIIKWIETESAAADPNVDTEGGRIITMMIICNNEIIVKVAAKEVRILHILCQWQQFQLKGKPSK